MMNKKRLFTLISLLLVSTILLTTANAAVVDDMLGLYQQQGAQNPRAANGEKLWNKTFTSSKSPRQRSCASCHTRNLHDAGKHAKTRKAIEPLAPSVNQERLTDAKKIRKWFKRNCKWTLGRECSPQEKADFLSYIKTQ